MGNNLRPDPSKMQTDSLFLQAFLQGLVAMPAIALGPGHLISACLSLELTQVKKVDKTFSLVTLDAIPSAFIGSGQPSHLTRIVDASIGLISNWRIASAPDLFAVFGC